MSDLRDLPEEEREIVADEQAAEQIDEEHEAVTEEDEEPAKTEYLEFLGTDPRGFGTEFYAEGVVGHTVTRKHLKDVHDVTTQDKDLAWTKAAAGKHKGRMLVPVADVSPEALDILENDPMFKRVSL